MPKGIVGTLTEWWSMLGRRRDAPAANGSAPARAPAE
jgi:hypothetical protein